MNVLLRLIHVYGSCDIHGSKLISTPASGWQALPGHLLLPVCFSALYAIGAICSTMNQRLVNFYGSVVTFCILLFFIIFLFSSTPYWFQGEVKPGGNQEPFIPPHISASWSSKYQGSMMNCAQYESHCDTTYWFLRDWAVFGVPVWQVVLVDLGVNKCERSGWSRTGQSSS